MEPLREEPSALGCASLKHWATARRPHVIAKPDGRGWMCQKNLSAGVNLKVNCWSHLSGSLALVPACRALCECTAALPSCQPSQAGRPQQLHHFLRPQKYPQVLGRTPPLHGPWEGNQSRSQSPPVRRKWVQILGSQSPAETLPMGRESSSACTAPGTGTAQDSSPLRLSTLLTLSHGSTSPGLAPSWPVLSLLLPEATRHSKHSTLQAAPRPQLQLEWPLQAPHKSCLSHTPGAVGQLWNRSCIPLVRFQLPFSATCFL